MRFGEPNKRAGSDPVFTRAKNAPDEVPLIDVATKTKNTTARTIKPAPNARVLGNP